MRKLLAASLEIISVLGLHGILDSTGDGVVGAEDGALNELDFTRGISLQATSGTTARLLALSPCFG